MLNGSLVKTITSDGLEFAGFFSKQKSDIAVFHNHGTSGDFYTHEFLEKEAHALAQIGISFLSANNRGHDVYNDIRFHEKEKVLWKSIGGGFEKFEDCIIDIKSWMDFLLNQEIKKVILQSHSLTQKILYYQSQKRDIRVVGQIHISPCNDTGLVFAKFGEKKHKEIGRMVNKMIKENRGNELLPKELHIVCPMSALAFSGYLLEESVGNLFPYHHPNSPKWNTLSQTKDHLLAIFGEKDIYINNTTKDKKAKSAAALFAQKAVSSKSITTKVIKNAQHSYMGQEKELVDIMIRWIQKTYQI